jgi:small-conductance mechanosensitive channel
VRWEDAFQDAERLLADDAPSAVEREKLAGALERVAMEARRLGRAARREIEDLSRIVDVLGAPPGEGVPAEPAEVAQRRIALVTALSRARSRLSEAEYAMARAEAMLEKMGEASRAQFVGRLSERSASPLVPQRMAAVLPRLGAEIVHIVAAPMRWYETLSAEERDRVFFGWWSLLLVAALVAGAVARRLLLRRLGPDPDVAEPSYARRFVAAVATAVGKGVLPSAVLLAVWARVRSGEALITGLAADVVASACLGLVFYILTHAATEAILRPEPPSWRLTGLTASSARRLQRAILFLAAAFSLDQFLRNSAAAAEVAPDVRALYSFFVVFLEGIGLIALTRARAWQVEGDAPEGEAGRAVPSATASAPVAAETAPAPRRGIGAWRIVRMAVAALAALAMVAFASGYLRLGFYLIDNLVVTAAVLGALFIVRGLFRDLIELLPTASAKNRRTLVPRVIRLGTMRMWALMVLDPLLAIVAVYLVVPSWGLPRAEISRWIGAVLQGFDIGGVTISLIDIALALVVFVAVLIASRMLRTALDERILPKTTLDIGIRNSVAVGVGYLGIVFAFLVAVSVLGLSLSNIAIVAGALSVGIGFGLQNIVNNFVSGLILLFERPIKVGDWVVVGGHEGYVRRINVRATEIETFQRSAVIVPNSEMLSTALVNWTHKDKLGRVEVKVGVAYGSDCQRVHDTLMACAEERSDLMSWPRPFVIFRDFGDSALEFMLYVYVRDVDRRMRVASELRFAIERAFRARGIEIPFPQRVVHLAGRPSTGPRDADEGGRAGGREPG